MDLQSTMVRLRLDRQTLGVELLEFTIHYGEIKTIGGRSYHGDDVKFTIHYGEIKTIVAVTSSSLSSKFTIHYGEIKTNAAKPFNGKCSGFTIHYGEIKTLSPCRATRTSYNLQSTMVRLRPIVYVCSPYSGNDLQSTMVRLRLPPGSHAHRQHRIYNPLW